MAKILVGIMTNGEQEFRASQDSLKNQKNCDFDYFIIAGKSSFEAHKILYANFTAHQANYCGFMKLDADMVLVHDDILHQAHEILSSGQYGLIMHHVHDYLSQLITPALYVFRNDCQFYDVGDPLLHDTQPLIVGESYFNKAVWANHMPNCSYQQAVRFGFHRSLKIIQINSYAKILRNMLLEWTVLQNVYFAYKKQGDERRLWALLAAHHVIFGKDSDRDKVSSNYGGSYVEDFVFSVAQQNPTKIFDQIANIWQDHLTIISQIAKLFEKPPLDSAHMNFQLPFIKGENYEKALIQKFV